MVKQRVLIADDEPGIRVALEGELTAQGFDILRGETGTRRTSSSALVHE